MMRWIRDPHGRFAERPYFQQDEIDGECEDLVFRFLREYRGTERVEFPIKTDELTVLLEQQTSDVDWYADLSVEGAQIEGMTVFPPDSLPIVSIAEEIKEGSENRLRTTITHELGHVKFHAPLWALKHAQGDLFQRPDPDNGPRCHRDTMLHARQVDWMEWQAGYACGAYLMPVTPLRRLVTDICKKQSAIPTDILSNSELGDNLISVVQQQFQVSAEAAYVRLLKIGYLTDPNSDQEQIRFN